MKLKELLNIHRQATPLAPYQEKDDMRYIGTLSLLCCDWILYQDSDGNYWTEGEWKL